MLCDLQWKFCDVEVSWEHRHFRQFVVSDFSVEEQTHYISIYLQGINPDT